MLQTLKPTSSLASIRTVSCRNISHSAALLQSRRMRRMANVRPAESSPTVSAGTPRPASAAAPTSAPAAQARAHTTTASAVKHDSDTRPDVPRFENGMLAREFISSSLYRSDSGYFNASQRVFRSEAPATMRFPEMKGRSDYFKAQGELYKRFDDCWLTPVEMFKPYYAQAIARWILEGRRRDLGDESIPPMLHPEEDGAPPKAAATAMEEKAPAEVAPPMVMEVAEDALAASGFEFAQSDPVTPASSASSKRTGTNKPVAAAARKREVASDSSHEFTTASSITTSSSSSALPPLRIIELGGGNGTLAVGVLNYLERHYPSLYHQTEYTIVELSEFMIETQRETLSHHLTAHRTSDAASAGGIASKPRVRLLNMSMISWRELVLDETVFVVGLEVLDNMPHDRLCEMDGVLRQVHVVANNHDGSEPDPLRTTTRPYSERLMPVSDPWIVEYGGYWNQLRPQPPPSLFDTLRTPSSTRKEAVALYTSRLMAQVASRARGALSPPSVWFPTTALQLLHILKHYLPRHHILLADFSFLPSTVEGANGPVVSAKSTRTGGRSVDFGTYLIAQGAADIFFPTDFEALRYVFERVCRQRDDEEAHARAHTATQSEPTAAPDFKTTVGEQTGGASDPASGVAPRPHTFVDPRVMSQYDFVGRYAAVSLPHLTTRSGWNPMRQDYCNFHFFLV